MYNTKDFILESDTSQYNSLLEKTYYSDYIPVRDSYIFAIQKQSMISVVQGDLGPFTENIFNLFRENVDKENLYIKAIENLLKQKEYLNLVYQASNNLISNDEFNEELEKNEEKYLIKIDNNFDNRKFQILIKALEKIKYNFSDDDISEIFSMETNNISNFLESNNNNYLEDEIGI